MNRPMSTPKQIVVMGGFDDLKACDLRFLEEAAKLGELTVLLWMDDTIQQVTGKRPKFPLVERSYFLNAVRYVRRDRRGRTRCRRFRVCGPRSGRTCRRRPTRRARFIAGITT